MGAVTIRIPTELHKRIRRAAEDDRRSKNSEIILLPEDSPGRRDGRQ